MKRVWSILALSAFCSLAAFGDTLCDSAAGTIAADDSTLTGVGSCSVDGVTFSNFVFTATTGWAANTPFSFSVSINPSMTNLDFHTPNMFGTSEDGVFTFQSSQGIEGVTLGTAGTDIVTETVCSQPFNGIECEGTILNTSPLGSNSGTTASSYVNTAPVDYFLKDDSNGSDFFEGFAAVPEPMTLSLMGAGLLGLGLFGRSRLRK